jgi:predicted restriction endonuclease
MNPARRSGWAAGRWRAKVLAQTGGRCAICGSTDRVQAHHFRALADGGSPDGPGVALCAAHHQAATGAQRGASAKRLSR